MKCNHCGSEFEGRFCPECGARANFGSTQPEQQVTQSVVQKGAKPKKKKKAVIILLILIVAFGSMIIFGDQGDNDPVESTSEIVENYISDNNNSTEIPEVTTESTTIETTTKSTTTEKEDALVDGMRPEFKAAMDSYETFMTDYVDFMKKFEEDSSNLSILADYADYMKKYAEFVEDFEKWDDEEMNTAETAYYIDVQARVSKKLLEVAE